MAELWETTTDLFPNRKESRTVIGVILLAVCISVSEILLAHFFSLIILPNEPRDTKDLVFLGAIFLVLFSILRLVSFGKEHYRINLFEKSASAPWYNGYSDYNAEMTEIHHIHKLDAPSGTAISLAEDLIKSLPQKDKWALQENTQSDSDLSIKAIRENEVPGTHSIRYSSAIDDIEITHTAHNRQGFALGAVIAAEYLNGKQGVYSMRDVLNLPS